MKKITQIVLDDKDRDLLKSVMPVMGKELKSMRSDIGYCGSDLDKKFNLAVKPYYDSGLYEECKIKSNLIEAILDLENDLNNVDKLITLFMEIDPEIKVYMEINDIVIKMQGIIDSYVQLKKSLPYLPKIGD